jgi:hypothetical protein
LTDVGNTGYWKSALIARKNYEFYKNPCTKIDTLGKDVRDFLLLIPTFFSLTYVVFDTECSENLNLMEIGVVKLVIVQKARFLHFLSTFIKVVTGDLHNIRETLDVVFAKCH